MSTSNATKGNKALTYPVGLITMDEVVYGGGYNGSNNSYYLYTGQYYWTMSPYEFNGINAGVRAVLSFGSVDNSSNVVNTDGVRPVISLKSSVELTGNGTMGEPYVVQ